MYFTFIMDGYHSLINILIIMNSNVFEEKAAAKRLLQEMGG